MTMPVAAPETTDAAEIAEPASATEAAPITIEAVQPPPLPTEGQDQPGLAAPPAARPPAPSVLPSVSPRVQAPLFADLGRQYQEQQQRTAELEARYQDAIDAQAVQQFRSQMETGYPGVDMGRLVGQYQQLLQQTRGMERQQREIQQQYERFTQNQQAKGIVAQRFVEEYGATFNEMMRYDDPQLMEAKAQVHQARQELTKLKQAAVKPSTPTDASPSRARVSITPDNVDRLWMDGKISDAEYKRHAGL